MTKPVTSAIIPAYNEGAVIGQVVTQVCAVLRPRDEAFEVIVVDDGSDDDTAVEAEDLARYAEEFNKDHPDIKINWVRDSTGIVTAKLLAEKDRNSQRRRRCPGDD